MPGSSTTTTTAIPRLQHPRPRPLHARHPPLVLSRPRHRRAAKGWSTASSPGPPRHSPRRPRRILRMAGTRSPPRHHARGHTRVAMQYSPRNAIMYVSMVDAGTVEMIREMGKEIVSSADLVSQFEAVLTDAQIATHYTAQEKIDRLLSEGFKVMGTRARNDGTTEFAMVQWLSEAMRREGLIWEQRPQRLLRPQLRRLPLRAHRRKLPPIRPGDFVLIDIWGKAPHARRRVLRHHLDRRSSPAHPPTASKPSHHRHRRPRCRYKPPSRPPTRRPDHRRIRSRRRLPQRHPRRRIRRLLHPPHRPQHRPPTSTAPELTSTTSRPTTSDSSSPTTCFSVEPGIYFPGEFGLRRRNQHDHPPRKSRSNRAASKPLWWQSSLLLGCYHGRRMPTKENNYPLATATKAWPQSQPLAPHPPSPSSQAGSSPAPDTSSRKMGPALSCSPPPSSPCSRHRHRRSRAALTIPTPVSR